MRVLTGSAMRDEIASRRAKAPYREVLPAVQQIIEQVRCGGDAAVIALTGRFDRVALTPAAIEVSQDELGAARLNVAPELASAVQCAFERAYAFHKAAAPGDFTYSAPDGVRIRRRAEPLQRVGIYAPRGSAGYPSSIIMAAAAARAAGVPEIILCTPPCGDGRVSALSLYTASICGIERVFRIGGATAIAAMAFGTETVPAVDKIAGPGNEYVSAAKRLVYGLTGIDMIAGPSEVAIIADGGADPGIVAADLLAQAEHGHTSWAVLLTDSPDLVESVRAIVDEDALLASRVTGVALPSLAEAEELASLLAPEHLEVFARHPDAIIDAVKNCGAVFVGPSAGAPLGDYALGGNHILPTGGSARFSSGLSAADFMRFTNITTIDGKLSPATLDACYSLAAAEGFLRHAAAVDLRRRK